MEDWTKPQRNVVLSCEPSEQRHSVWRRQLRKQSGSYCANSGGIDVIFTSEDISRYIFFLKKNAGTTGTGTRGNLRPRFRIKVPHGTFTSRLLGRPKTEHRSWYPVVREISHLGNALLGHRRTTAGGEGSEAVSVAVGEIVLRLAVAADPGCISVW